MEFAIDGKMEIIEAIVIYLTFIKEEYKKLFQIDHINEAKAFTFLEILLNSAGRILLRLIADSELVDEI